MDKTAKIDSEKLFNERAGAASPGFVINERNGLVIAHICQHLAGIPLAFELAAAYANVLTIEQILNRLDNRFNLLTRGTRTVLPRQQTLLGKGILCQIVRADAEKVNLACELLCHLSDRRDFHHDGCFYFFPVSRASFVKKVPIRWGTMNG